MEHIVSIDPYDWGLPNAIIDYKNPIKLTYTTKEYDPEEVKKIRKFLSRHIKHCPMECVEVISEIWEKGEDGHVKKTRKIKN